MQKHFELFILNVIATFCFHRPQTLLILRVPQEPIWLECATLGETDVTNQMVSIRQIKILCE